jgi:hypothetical protein
METSVLGSIGGATVMLVSDRSGGCSCNRIKRLAAGVLAAIVGSRWEVAMTPKLISVKDALQRYALGRTKFYELVSVGAIHVRKLGKRTLVVVEHTDAFFDQLPDRTGFAP